MLARLNVMESKEKKATLENPGAQEIMTELGGARSGVPYFAFLNEQGKKTADSNAMPGGQNIGYPAKPEEIDAFRKLLKQAAPHLTGEQMDPLIAYLREPVAH